MMDAEALVFVVDDDASLHASLQDLLESGFVNRPCPAFSVCVWPHLPTLPTQTASAVSVGLSSRDEATIRELGRDYGHGAGCLRGK
jgi:hypothetical protein